MLDPCSTCTLIPSTQERPWPVPAVKKLGVSMLGFGVVSGFALGVLSTLMVWHPW